MTAFQIKDSTAFVTGTNKQNGIGRAIVKELVRRGASKIYATARSIDQLADLVSEHPQKVVAVALDVTDERAVRNLGSQYSDVNLLVNNAGYFSGLGALNSPELAEKEIAVNYIAPLRITQSFAPLFEKRESSAVVNINSIASLVSLPAGGTYSASKAATHSLTQSQRRELGHSLVVGVYPGPIDTEMARTLPFDKVPASDVAEALAQALENGTEDVFPDPMSQQLLSGWKSDAKALERQLAIPSEAAE